jgi:predicted DCC family thiol-disulfide oxidoreductase YuxK
LDPVLLYDGGCGFCTAIVQFIVDHERERTLRFAPLQGATADRIFSYYSKLHDTDSVVWVDRDPSGVPERVLVRSAAVLRVARYLGGGWRLLTAFWIVPRPLRDWVYDVVARHRHRLAGAEVCPAPTSESRHRFLD